MNDAGVKQEAESDAGGRWTRIGVFTAAIGALATLGVTVSVSLAIEANAERRHLQGLEADRQQEQNLIDEQAHNVVLKLSRTTEGGSQPLELKNNGATPLLQVQAMYNYAARPALQTGDLSASPIPEPSLLLDVETSEQGCIDVASGLFVLEMDSVDPDGEMSLDVPTSAAETSGEDIVVQFREANSRGQWWEIRPGSRAMKIERAHTGPTDSVCFSGLTSAQN